MIDCVCIIIKVVYVIGTIDGIVCCTIGW